MRVKRGLTKRAKHNKILERAKGFRGTKGRLLRVTKEALLHAGNYAFAGRKQRKTQMRTLWIVRLSAALQEEKISYSKFIKALKDSNVELDRKILANIALEDPETFKEIVKSVVPKKVEEQVAQPQSA